MSDPADEAQPTSRQVPGWLFVVVPMLFAALLVGGVSIAVRSSGDDDGAEDISGPAAELPAVVDAAEQLRTTTDAVTLGGQYGTIAAAYATLEDDVEFAAEFDRLPDAEVEVLGRTLGTIQNQLSPTAIGGARTDEDRGPDIVYALGLARGTVQALDPDASPRDQALDVLPFAEQLATGDLTALAATIDATASGESGATGALTDAGAAELVSSIAFLIRQRLPSEGDTDYAALFDAAYQQALPL